MAEGKLIGKITHFYGNINVAVIELDGGLSVGDRIKISGRGQEFEQGIDSIQVEHESVAKAKKGDAIGLHVDQKVKEGDLVYKL